MVLIDFKRRLLNCKIVYYGPGLSGKTTNVESVHKGVPDERKEKLISIKTEGDRTLFFDFFPLSLGKIKGLEAKFGIYTVPGQVYYNATRRQVLKGVDGMVFVADSDPAQMDENIESFQNLVENLKTYNLDIQEMPLVLQYNKRDLPEIMSVEDMDASLNYLELPTFEAVALTGEGVFPTLKAVINMVVEKLNI